MLVLAALEGHSSRLQAVHTRKYFLPCVGASDPLTVSTATSARHVALLSHDKSHVEHVELPFSDKSRTFLRLSDSALVCYTTFSLSHSASASMLAKVRSA